MGEQIPVRVRLRPFVEGALTVGASVGGREQDPELANNSKLLTVTVKRAADLGVTMAMSKEMVQVGETFWAVMTLTNRGPAMAREGSMDVSVPDGCVVVAVETALGSWTEKGDSVHFVLTDFPANETGTARVGLRATRPGMMTSNVKLGSRELDPNPGDNTAAASSTAKWGADVAVTVLRAPKRVLVGAEMVYSIIVTNSGPQEAAAVLLTTPFSASTRLEDAQTTQGIVITNQEGMVTVELGTLPVGGTAQVDLMVVPTATGTMTNTAVLTGDFADPDPLNNARSANTEVHPVPDLLISQVSTPNPAMVAGTPGLHNQYHQPRSYAGPGCCGVCGFLSERRFYLRRCQPGRGRRSAARGPMVCGRYSARCECHRDL